MVNWKHEGQSRRKQNMARPTGRLWLAITLLLGLICPLLFSTWYMFTSQKESLQRAFHVELERMVMVLAEGMREPIWNLTPEHGQPVLDSMMRDPRVSEVTVTAVGQGDFLQAYNASVDDGQAVRIDRQVVRGKETIGNVSITLVPIYLRRTLRDRWPKLYVLGAIQIVLGLLVVLFVYRMLQRQEREHALQEMNALLSAQVEARASELESAQEELLRAESLSVLGRLTATVSHELRNPLGTIAISTSGRVQIEIGSTITRS